MSDKEKRLTADEVKGVLAGLGEAYDSAPPHIRGAVLVLASEDSGGGFFGMGGYFAPLKFEIYSHARALLNDWILQQVLTPEQYAERQQAFKEARGVKDE